MNTSIYECDSNGKISKLAEYSVAPEQALINYIQQYIHGNWNTANYPKHMKSIRESRIKKNLLSNAKGTDALQHCFQSQTHSKSALFGFT